MRRQREWASTEYIVEVDCTPQSGMETKVIYAHSNTSENYRVIWGERKDQLTSMERATP